MDQHYVPERFDGNAFKSLSYIDLINFAYQVCTAKHICLLPCPNYLSSAHFTHRLLVAWST